MWQMDERKVKHRKGGDEGSDSGKQTGRYKVSPRGELNDINDAALVWSGCESQQSSSRYLLPWLLLLTSPSQIMKSGVCVCVCAERREKKWCRRWDLVGRKLNHIVHHAVKQSDLILRSCCRFAQIALSFYPSLFPGFLFLRKQSNKRGSEYLKSCSSTRFLSLHLGRKNQILSPSNEMTSNANEDRRKSRRAQMHRRCAAVKLQMHKYTEACRGK